MAKSRWIKHYHKYKTIMQNVFLMACFVRIVKWHLHLQFKVPQGRICMLLLAMITAGWRFTKRASLAKHLVLCWVHFWVNDCISLLRNAKILTQQPIVKKYLTREGRWQNWTHQCKMQSSLCFEIYNLATMTKSTVIIVASFLQLQREFKLQHIYPSSLGSLRIYYQDCIHNFPTAPSINIHFEKL